MTKNIVPALNHEALLAKSKVYIHRALKRKEQNDFDEYQLWASLALELLGKSALANFHPSLIADPQSSTSLFAAAGINISTDIKTISAHTLFERLRHVISAFDEKTKKFCTEIAQRRNAELHSGETPFKAMKIEAWEAQFWYSVYLILQGMNLSLDEWLGASQAKAPSIIISHAIEARQAAVVVRVERHKEKFLERKKSDRDAALAEAAKKRPFHYNKLFTLLSDEEWETSCPSCGGKAFSAGVKISEQVVDTYTDNEAPWELVEKEYSAEQFHCPVCDLWLDGVDELEAANLPTTHTETDEREMEYEPDYGND